jgi:NAD(P)-dependent dehydrogenase (short-subunit alcohol dehydrogenase family)
LSNPKTAGDRRVRFPLTGKVAVVTGASRGIGLAIARALGVQGCDLVLTARDLQSLEKAGKELSRKGRRVLLKSCDVRDPDSIRALSWSVKERFGRIDVLVNNAGVAHPSLPVEKLPYAVWQDVLSTNLTGTFLVTQAMLPQMRRGATVVNNLSIAAIQGFANSAAYCASKHGALGLTKTLREELRPRGIRVIALLPGATDTDIWEVFWPEAPRKKMMSAETVAGSVVSALIVPEQATVEEMKILPLAGTL